MLLLEGNLHSKYSELIIQQKTEQGYAFVSIFSYLTFAWNGIEIFSPLYYQVRDYIHVVDLADGHTAALTKLSDPKIGAVFLTILMAISKA